MVFVLLEILWELENLILSRSADAFTFAKWVCLFSKLLIGDVVILFWFPLVFVSLEWLIRLTEEWLIELILASTEYRLVFVLIGLCVSKLALEGLQYFKILLWLLLLIRFFLS